LKIACGLRGSILRVLVSAMSSPSRKSRWITRVVGNESFELLDLGHSDVEARIVCEMDAGIDVYYDRRWGATEIFARWVLEHPELVRGKRVLALGVGVGLETLALGRLCGHLFMNDLAPVSLELCAEQLRRNGIEHFTPLPGALESLVVPEVDLAVACFLIYGAETCAAMAAFVAKYPGEIVVANGPLPAFRDWLAGLPRPWESLFSVDAAQAIRVAPTLRPAI